MTFRMPLERLVVLEEPEYIVVREPVMSPVMLIILAHLELITAWFGVAAHCFVATSLAAVSQTVAA